MTSMRIRSACLAQLLLSARGLLVANRSSALVETAWTLTAVGNATVSAAAAPTKQVVKIEDVLSKHLSDKVMNGYGDFYEVLLSDKKNLPLQILEVGLGTKIKGAPASMDYMGKRPYKQDASLYAWREYFPNAHIYGIDIQKDTMLQNQQRIVTSLTDSTSPFQVARAMRKFGCKDHEACFDLIVDDGLHTEQGQLNTLANTFPRLKTGGLYILEDIMWNYKMHFVEHPSIIREVVGERSALFFIDNFRNSHTGQRLHTSAVMVIKKL